MIVNKTQLADIVGKTTDTLTDWQKLGMPIEVKGARGQSSQYNTAKVIEWMIKRAEGDKPSVTLDETRQRKVQIDADRAALELAKERGDLVPKAEIKKQIVDALVRFKTKVRATPRKIAMQIVAAGSVAEAEDLLAGQLDEALNELRSLES